MKREILKKVLTLMALFAVCSVEQVSFAQSSVKVISNGVYRTAANGFPIFGFRPGYFENPGIAMTSPSKWVFGLPIVYAPDLDREMVRAGNCINPGHCANVGLTTDLIVNFQNTVTFENESLDVRCGHSTDMYARPRIESGMAVDLPFADDDGNPSNAKCQSFAQLVYEIAKIGQEQGKPAKGVFELTIHNAKIVNFGFVP